MTAGVGAEEEEGVSDLTTRYHDMTSQMTKGIPLFLLPTRRKFSLLNHTSWITSLPKASYKELDTPIKQTGIY